MSARIRYNACPCCGGDLHPLGGLGNLTWYRCRHCGIQTSREAGRPRRPKAKAAQTQTDEDLC